MLSPGRTERAWGCHAPPSLHRPRFRGRMAQGGETCVPLDPFGARAEEGVSPSGGSLRSPPAKHGSTPSGPQVLILLCPGLSTASCRNNRQKLRRESLHSAGVSCSIVLERLAPGVGRTVRRAGWGCNAFVASPCRSRALQAEGGTFCRGFLCLPGDKAYLCRRTTYKTFI